jgi:hypothetical protein
LDQRFALAQTQYLCQRFEKSLNVSEEYSVSDHLTICCGNADVPVAPAIAGVLLKMYLHVKSWFGNHGDIVIELWVAPTVDDLQFMTCMPCTEGYACAPGTKNGANIILIDSPSLKGKNSDEGRLSAVLAHEISHHFITDISRFTLFTMKRRERLDVPMWLEEGLATTVMTEVNPSFRVEFEERMARKTGQCIPVRICGTTSQVAKTETKRIFRPTRRPRLWLIASEKPGLSGCSI